MANNNKRHYNKRKKLVKGEPGDLIQMDDGQREFLKVHGKYVHNPEMELAMLEDEPSMYSKATFGAPLPWEKQMDHQDWKHFKTAKARKFKCKCSEAEVSGTYKLVPEVAKGGQDQVVSVYCVQCKEFIQMVKRSVTNRRLARDPMINGPHQDRRR